MQQAPVPPHQQTPYQQSFQATPQFAPSGPQLQGQQVISGNLQGQAHGRGFPQQQAQFQQPQQPMVSCNACLSSTLHYDIVLDYI